MVVIGVGVEEALERYCLLVGQRLEMARQSKIINQLDSLGLDVIQNTED